MSRLTAVLSAVSLAFLLTGPVTAKCAGKNLIDELPPDRLAEIQAATDAVPYPTGNFWRATRGDQVITIAGTYHFDDPRHEPNLAALAPHIETATTVLVEAGPEEEKALMNLIASDPSKVMITEGPTLLEQLPPELWESLSQAMAERGIPGFMAAKFRPWYVIAVLAVPPCAMAEMTKPKGLDGMVIDTATAAGVPVQGLEPYDTIFKIFGSMTEREMIDMLESSLLFEDRSEDYSATLADSYFAGDGRKIWEFMRYESYSMPGYTREQVDAEFAKMEEALMNERNRAWIPVLTEAATKGPVFTAFGALHLSGDEGVLNLLKKEGFTIEELPL
ncbi:TraB/GumN family protein [Tabrizicola sp.]|uniref:TraB/GumN family protein n=1 Tax=Tabrizicola sp. TaxID=2005166 RepID=UPI003F2C863C